MKLNIVNSVPTKLFEIESHEILQVFDGPTLIHLKSKSDKPALYISTLLHGNETTSFYVMQKFLQDKKEGHLERDIIIFVGNVYSAAQKERMLNNQPDFNRIWNGHDSEAGEIASQVTKYAQENNIFASIDIHNNTGHNPYYACVNRTDNDFIALASLFAPYVVYFTEPHEVQSMAFSKFVPAVTLECGIPGVEEGVDYVTSYLNKVYDLNSLSEVQYNKDKLSVYQTKARLMLNRDISLDYHFNPHGKNDVSLRSDIDDFNFRELRPTEVIALAKKQEDIFVLDNNNEDVTQEYLAFDNQQVSLKKEVVPSMLTTDGEIALKDCLGYFMESHPL